MALRLKRGVFPGGMSVEIMLAIVVAEDVYAERGLTLTVTSINDGKHKAGSKHYVGNAADLRVHNVPTGQLHLLFQELKDALPLAYDVILEGEGTENAHIHLEWDPKSSDLPPSAGMA